MALNADATSVKAERPRYGRAIFWWLFGTFNLSLFVDSVLLPGESLAGELAFGLYASIIFPLSVWLGWLCWRGRPLPPFLAEAVGKAKASSGRGAYKGRGIVFLAVLLFRLGAIGVRRLRRR